MRYHPAVQLDRYHGLDALRAAMMLLGLVYHSSLFYLFPAAPADGGSGGNAVLAFLHAFIIFRMPIFFAVAGFFGALLYRRAGAAAFARNRIKRIALPLVIFWIAVVPLSVAAVGFTFGRLGLPAISSALPDAPWWRQPWLSHLWFLYFLLVFYAVALVLAQAASSVPASVRQLVARTFAAAAAAPWGAAGFAAVSFLTLLPMNGPDIDRSHALVPPLRELAAYGFCFAVGWHLHRERWLLEGFARWWQLTLIGGIASASTYAWLLTSPPALGVTALRMTALSLLAMSWWLLFYGLVGVLHRYGKEPRPLVQYFAQASYWMYLTHIVPALALPGLLASWPLPVLVKFTMVLAATIVSTAASYHLFVRSTAIGELLNGRRYPRVPFATLWRRSSFARGPSSPASSL